MPKLPDLDSLGARPVPQSRRAIASNPRAGAVGDAVASFGERLAQTGQKAIEKEDRLDLASSQAKLLQADIAARKELEADPDFETWETRYTELMRPAREEAARLIRSRSGRSLFEQDAEVVILRGASALAQGAQVRRGSAAVAGAEEQLAALQDAAQDATDDATRGAIIGTAGELLGSLRAQGYITAEEEGRRRREWRQNHIVQRAETLKLAGDLDGALSFLDANRAGLDAGTEMDLRARLTGALDDRDTLIEAEAAVHAASRPTPVPGGVAPAPQLTGWAQPVATQLVSAGFSDSVVAGFLGNFEVEGGTAGAQGDGGSASGIAQWRNERRANFRRMFGKEPHQASHDEQARFVVWEMNNPAEAGMTVAQRDAILAARTPAEAAALIDRHYERSSGQHRSRREEAARRYSGTTQAPQSHDLNNVYAGIDARAQELRWTPEKTEDVKAQAERLVRRDEGLLQRQYSTAADEAARAIAALPEGLTSLEQIPRSIRERMDPTAIAELQSGIRERQREQAEEAREASRDARAAQLEYMRRFLPDEYARVNPLQEAGRLGPEQYNKFLMDWTEARQGKPPKQTEIDNGIRNEIAFQERTGGVTYDEDDKVQLATGMEAQLGLIRERKGHVTADDFRDAYRTMTRQMPRSGNPAYEDLVVPPEAAARIRRAWTGNAPPTDAQILQTWMESR